MLRFSGAGLAATLLAGSALAQTPQADFVALGGTVYTFNEYYSQLLGAAATSGRINLPLGGLLNLEVEGDLALRFHPYGTWRSATGAVHLYVRDPERFAAGAVGVVFRPESEYLTMFGGGGEAQVILGRAVITGQGIYAFGRFSDCESCVIRLVQARGEAEFFAGPHTSFTLEGAFTRYTYYDDPFRSLSIALTGTHQVGDSPFALVASARFENFWNVIGGYTAYNEVTLLGGFRILLGPAGQSLQDAATLGPAMDVWLPVPRHSCFIGSTEILMADGTRRRIDEVEVGDWVVGAGGQYNRVVEIERPLLGERKLHAFGGGRAFVTAEHPFMTCEGWKSIDPEATREETRAVEAGVLTAADELVTLSAVVAEARPMRVAGGAGALAPIIDVTIETGYTPVGSITAHEAAPTTRVFNLRLDGNNTYFADGYLVHNK